MILWTVMPIEAIFQNNDTTTSYEQIEYAGVKMEVEKVSNNQSRIVRLLSTDPQDYLRDEIRPGTILTYKPF